MANEEHLALLRQGVDAWNQWRLKHPNEKVDLSKARFRDASLNNVNLNNANLEGADLRSADLINANLKRANLKGARIWDAGDFPANLSNADCSHADLNGVNLSGSNCINANFSEADLSFANLQSANLSNSNFNGANLSFTDFKRARLSHTNFSEAQLLSTVFANNDLNEAKGILEIRHQGPSYVELYTVKLPLDGSALHFLRGAGVPDEWIDFYRTQMMQPIQYYSVFISYSSKEDMLARRLHADLQAHGVRCWFAPEDLKIGNKFRQHIDEAIHLQDKLLLLLSEHSIASTWVETEVEAALEKEDRQQREVLFPVRLDDGVMQTHRAWAATLRRTRHIGEFTNWTDPQVYQVAFDRLLRDLKQN
jgi:uncharacterized protein YjbI with pentapeptide repeats